MIAISGGSKSFWPISIIISSRRLGVAGGVELFLVTLAPSRTKVVHRGLEATDCRELVANVFFSRVEARLFRTWL